jgi:hypothetical protein
MDLFKMLDELGQSWDVMLTSHECGPNATTWELRLTSATSWHMYRGELATVVRRAWAGERGELSGER